MKIISESPNSTKLAAISNYQKSLTVRAAMTADENQISFYRRENRPLIVGAIAVLLTEANNTMNVQRAPSPIQISMMAEEIVENWWMLRLDEVAYALRQGAAGMYGTAYGKFDKQTLIEWLKTYDTEERLAQVEWVNAQQKKQFEAEEKETSSVTDGYRRLQETYQKTGKDALSQQDKERTKDREKARWQEDKFLKWQAGYYAQKQLNEEQQNQQETI
ncbi:hypothetical protein [Runella salmonicolor]|uniref:Uncharacterized protein n=1 Tax=Runella salmonicolor TaxID=2950278 RepID=A0ABT1FSW8_9BACT|nr:hypothetical protein [Runella salmonicolor]MCP1384856.1 hypothetical protein [Runella salmonicolor]